jgi:hypothetical protein
MIAQPKPQMEFLFGVCLTVHFRNNNKRYIYYVPVRNTQEQVFSVAMAPFMILQLLFQRGR